MVHADALVEADVARTIAEHLDRADSGWAIGAFGAIAEFMRDGDEPLLVAEGLTRATARGAIRLGLHAALKPVAYETVSAKPDRWLHGVAFCLPAQAARMSERSVLTELGPDRDAVLEEDRAGILFDIGAGVANVDACLRVSDPELAAFLRGHEGEALVGRDDLMDIVTRSHPHRVFVSRLGRIEVRQRIGSDDADPPTPEGPHTHVLPKVLARRRTYSANLPVPPGFVPGLHLYPANPTFNSLGRPRRFDRQAFARFQRLLHVWGDPDCFATKHGLAQALERGISPETFKPAGRHARAATRVALRQLAYTSQKSDALRVWRDVHDAAKFTPEDDHPDH